jgi:hypothetical protein
MANKKKKYTRKPKLSAKEARYNAAHPSGRYSYREFQQMCADPLPPLWQHDDVRKDWPFPGANPRRMPDAIEASPQDPNLKTLPDHAIDAVYYCMWRYVEIEVEARIAVAACKDAQIDLEGCPFLSDDQRVRALRLVASCDRTVSAWRQAWKTAAKYKDTYNIPTGQWLLMLKLVREAWLDGSHNAPTTPATPKPGYSAAVDDCGEDDEDGDLLETFPD